MIYTKLMHRIRVIAIALSIFLILPLSTSADTPSTNSGQVTAQERTALISQLVQKVLELQQKIVALGGTPIACTLTKTLSLGTRGEEVRCLQRYLIAQVETTGRAAHGSDAMTWTKKKPKADTLPKEDGVPTYYISTAKHIKWVLRLLVIVRRSDIPWVIDLQTEQEKKLDDCPDNNLWFGPIPDPPEGEA